MAITLSYANSSTDSYADATDSAATFIDLSGRISISTEAGTAAGSITVTAGTDEGEPSNTERWVYAWATDQETEEERQAREVAFKRAEDLLKSCIGLEAFNQLHDIGYIELDSQKHKGRKYRIPKEHMEMIDVLNEEGEVIDRLCIHPAIDCPAPDHILSRVVLLKFAEEYALAKADHHEPRGELVFSGIEDGGITVQDG